MYYYFLLFFLLALTTCQTPRDSTNIFYGTQLIPSQEVILSHQDIIYPVSPNFRIVNGKRLLTVYDDEERELITFDLARQQMIEEIPIDFFQNQNLYSYHYYSSDSIFLGFSAAPHLEYWHDSVLLQVNQQGQLQKVHSTALLPVRSSHQPFLSKDHACVVGFHMGNIHYQNGQIHFLLPRYRFSPGDSLYEHHPKLLGGYMSTTDNIPHYYPITFPTPPQIIGRGYLPRNFNFPRWIFDEKGQPLFGFGHTANVFYYNATTEQFDTHNVSSLYTDTLHLHLYPDRYDAPQHDYAIPEYLELYRNPYQHHYARVLRLPDATLIDNPFDPRFNSQAEPPATVVLFDDNFQHIGEFLVPVGYSNSILFFDQDGVWLYHEDKSKQLKKLVLQKFTLEHYPTTKTAFRTAVQNALQQRKANNKAQ